jgi:cytosine/adenosine deaminase-related metal-dependent hydrolase
MILLENCFCVATSLGTRRKSSEAACNNDDLRNVDILIDKNRIARIEASIERPQGATVIDASRHLVLPGLVNTHHHFFQTLTRALPAVQGAKLFDWLVYLYEIWKFLDEDAVYWSSRLALAELVKTGCTLASDHHYLYPAGLEKDIPGLQFEAASDLGIRFAPTRGSMSLSKKDGGLPPDSVVQDEDRILSEYAATIDRYHDPSPDAMRKVSIAPCSPFSVSERAMRDAVRLARAKHVRIHTHLAETEDENEYCVEVYGRRPLRLMEDCGLIGPDVWYAHGIYFTDDELAILARTGTGVAHCPSSNMRLGSGVARVREMLDLGIPVGLGVDGSSSNDTSDMLGEARQAMLLQRIRYGSGGLSAREALSMATEGGSRILGFEQAGRIEVGALADLALFDLMRLEYSGSLLDPTAAILYCGYNHGADYVIVDGKLILERGRLCGPGTSSGVGEEEIRVNADKASRRLLAKAGII